MENRAQQHHRERQTEALKDELVAILEGELADPRIGLVNVSEVHLSPDGRSAQIYIAVMEGDDDAVVETMHGLDAAKTYIRRELTDRLRLRQAPELIFRLDRSEQYSARIDQLLERIRLGRKS
jgi:ribosome-binding factor A